MDHVPYAHTVPNAGPEHWEKLEDHLQKVADGIDGASEFAAVFGARELGGLLGLWHDLGKYSAAFQEYLRLSANDPDVRTGRRVDHSTAGAQHAAKRFKRVGKCLAFCIAAHHGGLADELDETGETRSDLHNRLKKSSPEIADALRRAPACLLDQPEPGPPKLLRADRPHETAIQSALLVRMLFSCLIDADRLAAERFGDPNKRERRAGDAGEARALLETFDAFLDGLTSRAEPLSPVNRRRADLSRWCRQRAEDAPGFFSLTAPTGSGKTFGSMAFALRHAARHGLRRVVYALPFTSIIEQNAQAFRDALAGAGSRVVLEHHSAVDPSEGDEAESWARLAGENWDAPVIVTTNVQLLESLFANRASACRKLHRLARSVIVLDEAQALPVELIEPILAALRELVRNYNCSVVLCSATQPALERREGFKIGIEGARAIVPDESGFSDEFRRVTVERAGELGDEAVAERLLEEPRALCVVNTKPHAAALFRRVQGRSGEGESFHLSAAMCAAHRQEVLEQVRAALQEDRPCRVVSTQVIEAGVDVDFPVVYRAEAGLDSIVQAAGRCNREGRLERGRVVVFAPAPDDGVPAYSSEIGRDAATMREALEDGIDPMSLEAIRRYFELRLWRKSHRWDHKGILDLSKELSFRTIAQKFRLIDRPQSPVIVPYGDQGKALIDEVESLDGRFDREFARRVQRYTVNVGRWKLDELLDSGACAMAWGETAYLRDDKKYHESLGLCVDDTTMDPEALQVWNDP